ncbi:hypothetical protein H257_04067 [Aphanomyces astaci]|uniref:Uncharacterized protein n=1 Tax=Aphanomyces astaci TaxID=112090 RepID=W4GUE8_APHAT|nr:hypothetical protein H257_04067 [Aphanomyces astaci]ETV83312.1 hypothetical protein H257_04067 [Aphanomyces astaci]|eukprot:XP_009826742.1 hypothetical protein H257_04067 [Aphanomyces astaci]
MHAVHQPSLVSLVMEPLQGPLRQGTWTEAEVAYVALLSNLLEDLEMPLISLNALRLSSPLHEEQEVDDKMAMCYEEPAIKLLFLVEVETELHLSLLLAGNVAPSGRRLRP